jgi:hypothetical protein
MADCSKKKGKNIDIINEAFIKRKNDAHIFIVANGTVPVPIVQTAAIK